MITDTSNPWTAKREGTRVRIIGYLSFPVLHPQVSLRREQKEECPKDTISFQFRSTIPPGAARVDDAFRPVEHLELNVPSSVTHVRIADEDGHSFLVDISECHAV